MLSDQSFQEYLLLMFNIRSKQVSFLRSELTYKTNTNFLCIFLTKPIILPNNIWYVNVKYIVTIDLIYIYEFI